MSYQIIFDCHLEGTFQTPNVNNCLDDERNLFFIELIPENARKCRSRTSEGRDVVGEQPLRPEVCPRHRRRRHTSMAATRDAS